MRTNYIKLLLFIIAIATNVNCIQTKKQDRSGLTALVMNNWANGTATDQYTNGSLLIITRADLSNLSFTGQCFDTFTIGGIIVIPSNYYNTPAGGGGGLFNSDYKKYALSTSNCAALRFTGTNNTNLGSSTQRPDSSQSFNFRLYSCDPNNNPCSRAAITAAGF